MREWKRTPSVPGVARLHGNINTKFYLYTLARVCERRNDNFPFPSRINCPIECSRLCLHAGSPKSNPGRYIRANTATIPEERKGAARRSYRTREGPKWSRKGANKAVDDREEGEAFKKGRNCYAGSREASLIEDALAHYECFVLLLLFFFFSLFNFDGC